MTHNRKPHMTVLRLAAVLLILVMLSTSMVCGRYARYTSSDAAEDSARIAAFVFHVNDTQNHYLDISDIRQPGDNKTYKFTVSNYFSDRVISEVDEEFFLSLELRGSLPLECTLTGDGDNLSVKAVEMNTTTGLDAANGAHHIFGAAVQRGVEYELTVAWPPHEKNVAYSQAGLAELVLTIAAQQVD